MRWIIPDRAVIPFESPGRLIKWIEMITARWVLVAGFAWATFGWATFAWWSDALLAAAAQKQDKAAVLSLLKQRSLVNQTQADGTTALIWASHWGDRELAAALLKAGANPNAANRYGKSALAEAALLGDAELTDLLLRSGADANLASPEGETALIPAARSGNPRVIQDLLKHGAKPNVSEKWEGETPLMFAVMEGHPEAARLLIQAGADVNAVAHVSTLTRRTEAVGSRFQATRINGGLTALMFAARQGDLECTKVLLEGGAEIRHAEEEGITPLHLAIMNGHFDLAAYLLDHGADANDGSLYLLVDMRNLLETDFDHPPPKITDKIDMLGMIDVLLKHGADPNALNAKRPPDRIVVNFFTSAPPYSALERAARSDDVEVMRILLDHGGNVNLTHAEAKVVGPFTQSAPGSSLLMEAIQSSGSPTEIYFGPPPTDMVYRFPAKTDKLDAVKLCLERGADVNHANVAGDTALHLAAQTGDDTLVAELIAHGARIDAKNKKGFTPLDLANGKGGGPPGPPAPVRKSTVELLQKLAGGGA